MSTNNPFALLEGHEYMSLTTFRKNGEAKATPVWFAQIGPNLYVYTAPDSWKVKRIRQNPAVLVAPCKQNGELIGTEQAAGTARILSSAEDAAARTAFKQKYGFLKSVFDFTAKLRRGERIYLEITPRTDG